MATLGIYIGIRGSVIALDRATGKQLWKTSLHGSQFVNVLLDGDRLIAATRGEAFCLDAATGQILWRNKLPGEGMGLATIATASGSSGVMPSFQEKQKKDDASAAAMIGVIGASS